MRPAERDDSLPSNPGSVAQLLDEARSRTSDEEQAVAMLDRVLSEVSTEQADEWLAKTDDVAATQARRRAAAAADIDRVWRAALRAFGVVLYVAEELSGQVVEGEEDRSIAEDDQLYWCLTKLFASACMVGNSVHENLLAGFPEAALSRSRVLYELLVVTAVITTAPDPQEVARRYLRHHVVDGWLELQAQLDPEAVSLFGPAPDDEVVASWRDGYARLVEEYGDAYGRQYGWAAELMERKRVTFADLQRFAGMEAMRVRYRRASLAVHPTSRGVRESEVDVADGVGLRVGPTGRLGTVGACAAIDSMWSLYNLSQHYVSHATQTLMAGDAVKSRSIGLLIQHAAAAFVQALSEEERKPAGDPDGPYGW